MLLWQIPTQHSISPPAPFSRGTRFGASRLTSTSLFRAPPALSAPAAVAAPAPAAPPSISSSSLAPPASAPVCPVPASSFLPQADVCREIRLPRVSSTFHSEPAPPNPALLSISTGTTCPALQPPAPLGAPASST
ncbi:hypothetical protein NPIL_472961 [Nephila pilipes]|uniref:Uncharacterized protein n=1 Tax=Nephila pilipes TaxID=299642 RepID=A0A8X6R2H0_NEPPI|nr:hypothetical protein NPIL_472961 [Nephila pilipes]